MIIRAHSSNPRQATVRSSLTQGLSNDLIARFLCWHIQEQAFGELDPKIAMYLGSLTPGA
jgi:hypothetical protein